MLTILIFIVLLGVLVFVHELGHFLVAKWNGIKSEEFGFGFPPRIAGIYRDSRRSSWRLVAGRKEYPLSKPGFLFRGEGEPLKPASERPDTIYSVNWIPLGGFVKIKGEDARTSLDPDSFANKPAWTRVKVLGAGVFMNVLLAWALFAAVFMIGIPQAIEPAERAAYPEAAVMVTEVKSGSPAAEMGLKMGDEILRINGEPAAGETAVGDLIRRHAGEEVNLEVRRFNEELELSGVPRADAAPEEGALGFGYAYTVIKRFGPLESVGQGFQATYTITLAIFEAFGKMIASLFGGEKVPLDVTGPVGIVYLTKQMNEMGTAYLLQFAALLSLNLAIINILPVPALDGGRILFVIIEKLKGRPVSEGVEGLIHQAGFVLLLFLMLLITLRDFAQYDVFEHIGRLF
jgi:regulator of sigma E protease